MGYIESNLQKDENIIHRGKIHWFVFFPGLVYIILGYYICTYDNFMVWFIGLLVLLYGLSRVIDAIIRYTCTEFAITNKRAIVKTGFISRKIVELNNIKVESINFDQDIMGRIMDFGTVIICGTGSGKNQVEYISSPLKFKNKAIEVIDSSIT